MKKLNNNTKKRKKYNSITTKTKINNKNYNPHQQNIKTPQNHLADCPDISTLKRQCPITQHQNPLHKVNTGIYAIVRKKTQKLAWILPCDISYWWQLHDVHSNVICMIYSVRLDDVTVALILPISSRREILYPSNYVFYGLSQLFIHIYSLCRALNYVSLCHPGDCLW